MTDKKEPLYRLLRHHLSGTWVAQILGPGAFEDTLHIRGRRIWSWVGERLDNTQLVTRGPRPGDKLGSQVENDLPWGGDSNRCDMVHMTEEQFNAWMEAPEWNGEED